MTLYFAYGSNMSKAAMAARCPHARALGTATLRGWRFIVAESGYASIVPEAGGAVFGVLWRLTPRDVAALDAYENVAGGLYLRRTVAVRHGGETKPAMVYVARRSGEGRPRPGYLDQIVGAACEWNLPDDYVRALRARPRLFPRAGEGGGAR
jgi:gamma-glutamylcyclotransferase (GGCT)/AIG2-like uncharacterized protein YtfP